MAIPGEKQRKKRVKLSHADVLKKEAALEASLFGGKADVKFGAERSGQNGAAALLWADEAEAAEAAHAGEGRYAGGALALWEDRTGNANSAEIDDDDANDNRTARQDVHRRSGQVWHDPDDDAVQVFVASHSQLRRLRQSEDESLLSGAQYEERLRIQHRKLNPRSRWAKPRAGDTDEAAVLLEAGAALGRPARLPAGNIEVTPLNDANRMEPSKMGVGTVAFHPGGQLLLTAGRDKRLSIFQVDGVKNPKVQSVFFHDMPIYHAAFCCGGNRVVAAGRRRHWYSVDLGEGAVTRVPALEHVPDSSLETFAVCPDSHGQKPTSAFLGDEGRITLVSLLSNSVTGTLKMNGTVRSAAFSPDGQQLLSLGGDGVVYTWDMRSQRCLGRHVDEGTLSGASLACSSDYFAAGSDGGVVNLHSRAVVAGSVAEASNLPMRASVAPPLKTFMNLTTAITSVAFSPDQQVLAMGSRHLKNSLRLVHVHSRTVFANWPTARTPLSQVYSVAFSPGGGLLAIGTGRGRALLYRLNHYTSA